MNVEEWLRDLNRLFIKTVTGVKETHGLPSYEKNKTTHQILSELKEANTSANFQAEEEIKLMKTLTEEYIAETTRLTSILSTLNLDIINLPNDLRNLIKTVSSVTQPIEDIGDRDDSPCDTLPDITGSQTQALQQLQNLEKVQESLNQMKIMDNREQLATKKDTEFLSKKIGEYSGHVRHLEKKLQSVEYDPALRHKSLEKRCKELNLATETQKKLKSKLEIYSDLTPDLNLAKIQVQNLKEELSQLENLIADNISSINSA